MREKIEVSVIKREKEKDYLVNNYYSDFPMTTLWDFRLNLIGFTFRRSNIEAGLPLFVKIEDCPKYYSRSMINWHINNHRRELHKYLSTEEGIELEEKEQVFKRIRTKDFIVQFGLERSLEIRKMEETGKYLDNWSKRSIRWTPYTQKKEELMYEFNNKLKELEELYKSIFDNTKDEE